MGQIEEIKQAVIYLETLLDIKNLLESIDEKLEDLKYIVGATAIQ